MAPKMSPEQVRAWKRNWEAVNAFEIEELRRTPIDLKFRQMSELMGWAEAFGWGEKLNEGDEEVRERWTRLQRLLKRPS